ncbi:hypothetical protein Fmac_008138 [Flemingia macrophylla]|uniref:Uncharacterized protein n=1 Tax=Flemingia macrophylla TaxID=520843 RepID=A0ABD1MWL4_9FABA
MSYTGLTTQNALCHTTRPPPRSSNPKFTGTTLPTIQKSFSKKYEKKSDPNKNEKKK